MGDVTVSVSKGVFALKNGGKSLHKRVRKSQADSEIGHNIFSNALWYQSYHKMWRTLENNFNVLNNEMFSNTLQNLIQTVTDSYKSAVTEIPTVTLLTGINMPDHSALFSTLSMEMQKSVTPHVATIYADDCQNLKRVVESTVNQFINRVVEDDSEDFENDDRKPKIKRINCTFPFLQTWHEKLYGPLRNRKCSPVKRKMRDVYKILVVVFPDFESCNDKVVQDFILIVSSYLNKLPFVLVFGVATSPSIVHKSLPHHISSKIKIQIFNSRPSTAYLNDVIENIFFSDDCPFHLGGKVFNSFTDMFLYYDLSVKGFIKNFKFAMSEHFSYGNAMALCISARNLNKILEQLSHEDLVKIQKLPSVKELINNPNQNLKSKFLKDDEYFKKVVYEKIQEFHLYLSGLHLFLKCLHILVCDLPNSPLGKQMREIYCIATSKNIIKTSEYEECFKLIGFLSKDELSAKTSKICSILQNDIQLNKVNKNIIEKVLESLEIYVENIENATTVIEEETEPEVCNIDKILVTGGMDRRQLKEKLLEMSKKSKRLNQYEKIRLELVKYLRETFEQYLQEPTSKPFYEIFFFNDTSIKNHILGSHRAVVHTALNDPQHYLQCNCCFLKNEATIIPTMPDVCILYKLHLEYGKLINLYDWLQSFLTIVDPDNALEEENMKIVKPEFQARFTQAASDLEYLGFVKSSKRKVNFVIRLTWGG